MINEEMEKDDLLRWFKQFGYELEFSRKEGKEYLYRLRSKNNTITDVTIEKVKEIGKTYCVFTDSKNRVVLLFSLSFPVDEVEE